MITRYLKSLFLAVGATTMAIAAVPAFVDAAPPLPTTFHWETVVNNEDVMPGTEKYDMAGNLVSSKNFNSYNQPSVNAAGRVVIRARSKGGEGGGGGGGGGAGGEGGNQPTHGIYTRDMSLGDVPENPIVKILDRTTEVPYPNNLGTKFVETPSFPRIDIGSDTIATRGNHQPVWKYLLDDGTETRAGTTGIYANPFRDLITGASKLGGVNEFGEFVEVPGAAPWTMFDVFPGSPSVTDGKTIVFKGNYTVGGAGKTGVFYRDLEDGPAGGISPVILIANSTDTLIPGTRKVFGSTSPPSAAGQKAVFAGFDNEASPTLGGLYLADLKKQKKLKTLVSIGGRVPGEPSYNTFNRLGEGVAFDGRYVGFWGAWGTETETATVRLYCPTEGNKDRIAYCNRNLVCLDTGETLGDNNSTCENEGDPETRICYQEMQIPVLQGIFVHDTEDGNTRVVAKTGEGFDDFVFWNYSGKTPCVGNGHGQEGAEDDGEPARWRSSSFVAVSGRSTAFKAATGNVVGIYLDHGTTRTVLDTTMNGQALDPEAPEGSTITELGLEREGLRGDWLVINAKMGIEGESEEDGMAGIYATKVR